MGTLSPLYDVITEEFQIFLQHCYSSLVETFLISINALMMLKSGMLMCVRFIMIVK